MDEGSQRQGGCACGRLRYRLSGPPIVTHCCHCSYCQRETGSAFALNWVIEADIVTLEGDFDEVLTPSLSGKGQVIIRCPDCKVAVSSHYAGSGKGVHFIRTGTLDDRSDIRPDVHIYASQKQPWVETGDVPAHDDFYPPKEVLNAEQRRRWKGAIGR